MVPDCLIVCPLASFSEKWHVLGLLEGKTKTIKICTGQPYSRLQLEINWPMGNQKTTTIASAGRRHATAFSKLMALGRTKLLLCRGEEPFPGIDLGAVGDDFREPTY